MLIIFDLDDTLIDTTNRLTPLIFRKTLKIMINEGLEVEDENLAYKKLLEIDKTCLSSKESIKKFLKKINANESFYSIAFKTMVEPLEDNVKVFTIKNAKKILRHLTKNHIIALVSRGNKEFQLNKLQKAGIDTSIFSKIVITERKNKGSCYKKIIEQLNCSYQNTYVCGDNISVDLAPAKKMGCKTIHVKWGRGKFLRQDKNVDYTINFLDEIKGIIDQIKEGKKVWR